MKIGLVGLPNVGKSTLFNLILGRQIAKAENFPFCTIEPNIAFAEVVDKNLDTLGKISNSAKVIYPIIECVDIAGLVKGASSGMGLGNQFLSHIRQVDLILHILRCFEDEEVIHVDDRINPVADAENIDFELILSDIALLDKLLNNRKFMTKFSKTEMETILNAQNILKQEKMLNTSNFDANQTKLLKDLGLITIKPMIYVCNGPKNSQHAQKLLQAKSNSIQTDINNPTDLNALISHAYAKLGLITFYTTGPAETRGWSISAGTNARCAAGVIHSDFVKRFIIAKVCTYDDFVKNNGRLKYRDEGRDYIVKHQDICHFNLGR